MRRWSAAAAFALLVIGTVAVGRARRVPIGRFVELPYGTVTVDPSRMAGFRPSRDARAGLSAPAEAPTQTGGYEVGRPPVRPLVVTDQAEVFALALESLHRLDSASIGAEAPVRFVGAMGMAARPGGGMIVVDGEGIHFLDRELREQRRASPSLGATGDPLVRDDGSVVVGGAGGISAFAEDGRELFHHGVATRVRSWVAERPDGSLVFATDEALVVLSREGELVRRVDLGSAPVAGPAVALDGATWVVTRGALLRFDRELSLRRIAWPPAIPSVRDASIALASDGSARVSFPVHGLWCVSSNGRTRWLHDAIQAGTHVTVDADGASLVATRGGDLVLVDAAGVERWRARFGLSPSTRPVIARGGTIFLGTTSGAVVVLR